MKLTELLERAQKGATVEEVLADIELPPAWRKKIRSEAAAGARAAMLPFVVLLLALSRK